MAASCGSRVLRICSLNLQKRSVQSLNRVCATSVIIPKRCYYDYESNLTPDLERFVYNWSRVKNTLGSTPLKELPVSRGEWAPNSIRCGVVGVKLGSTTLYTKKGKIIPVTMVQVLECNVISYIEPGQHPDKDVHPRWAHVQVGAVDASPIYKPEEYSNIFRNAGVPVKRKLSLFKVTPNAIIQPGTPLFAAHFRPGMWVDACGRTSGKGFQGVMKRWGFSGQPASHGQTKTHRRPGAIGQGGTPSRVWPGKKMPGNMGNKLRWIRGLKVWRVNTRHNVLYLHGHTPGHKNSLIKIKDSILYHKRLSEAPPFPTYYPDEGEELDEDLYDDDLFRFTDESITYEEEED